MQLCIVAIPVRFALCSLMTSILLLLILTVGLVGVFFNVQMLMLGFVRNKTKYASLRKFTPFIIGQFIYQVTIFILATTTIEAWRALDDQQEKYLCVLKMLTISMKILLASNLTAISTMTALSDHSNVDKKGPQKLLVSVALCLGFT